LTTFPALVPWKLPPPDAALEDQAYAEALRRIWGFSEASRSAAELERGRTEKLRRVRSLLSLVGNPQARFASVLVAGTKGKGSMAAMLARVLEEAGYRVGRYTQPHLYSYRERVWAAGEFISTDALVDCLARLEPSLQTLERHRTDLGPLTTFDVGTVLALQHFADQQVDVAVVEVGVGGAHDATNVLEPIISLLGPVGLDHTATLGPTLTHIGREKAGVARRGRPLVVGRLEPEAMDAVRTVTGAIGANLVTALPAPGSTASPTFDVEGPSGTIRGLRSGLDGAFQQDNAAVVAVAAQLLARDGWRINDEQIRDGIAHVSWPGRLQTVILDPLTIVDGAHNPAAFAALAAALRNRPQVRPCTMVVGMTMEKDSVESLRQVAPLVDRVLVTRARHPRATPPEALAEAARAAGMSPEIVAHPEDAVSAAWLERPSLTLVTGSLFLVGDVLEWLWRESAARSALGVSHELRGRSASTLSTADIGVLG
jgi:dihydrofolate synthase / folylpolyglutamate synthase